MLREAGISKLLVERRPDMVYKNEQTGENVLGLLFEPGAVEAQLLSLGARTLGMPAKDFQRLLGESLAESGQDPHRDAVVRGVLGAISLERNLAAHHPQVVGRGWHEFPITALVLSRSKWTTTAALEVASRCDAARTERMAKGQADDEIVKVVDRAVAQLAAMLPAVDGLSFMDVVDRAVIGHVVREEEALVGTASELGLPTEVPIDNRRAFSRLRAVARRAAGWDWHGRVAAPRFMRGEDAIEYATARRLADAQALVVNVAAAYFSK